MNNYTERHQEVVAPMQDHPKTNGGRRVKRGDTFDPECHRTTYRLQIAQNVLLHLGVTQTWNHSDSTRVTQFGIDKHVCDYKCKCSWPEWATGETFDLAYRIACEVQTARGDWNRAEASRAKSERERAA